MKKILIIQTAFIGDVILATSLVESIHAALPDSEIDFVLRKGNESILTGNPLIRKIIIRDKKIGKIKSLHKTTQEIRMKHYDFVFNLHRFVSSGYITARAKSTVKSGYKNNPLSFFFTHKIEHETTSGKHEIQRNFELVKNLIPGIQLQKPKLYPQKQDIEALKEYAQTNEHIVMAPSSVWLTKQLPEKKWVELIQNLTDSKKIYLIGAVGDFDLLERIKKESGSGSVVNLAGKISLLSSAYLMSQAVMNYVNDSAPLHLASAMNAPVTAFFCSTIPSFGFGPLSADSKIIEVSEKLSCRPCGLHGYKVCPQGHFKCGNLIQFKP